MNKLKLSYTLTAIIYAIGILAFYLWIFFELANENQLVATVANFGIITFFILLEKIELTLYRYSRRRNRKLRRFLRWYLYGPSFKSTLYLIYVFIIIGMALLVAEPTISWLSPYYYFFLSMRYGVWYLIAIDKFTSQIFKDIKNLFS